MRVRILHTRVSFSRNWRACALNLKDEHTCNVHVSIDDSTKNEIKL